MRVFIFLFLIFSLAKSQTVEDLINAYGAGFADAVSAYDPTLDALGEPLGEINGPEISDKVVIVGAGWAGVHMAYELKKLGFEDVTIYEKLYRHGGKAFNVQYKDIMQVLTTVFVDNRPDSLIFKLHNDLGFGDDLRPSPPEYRQIFYGNSSSSLNMDPFSSLLLYNSQVLGITNPLEAIGNITGSLKRYVQLHQEMFGHFDGELMNKPSKAVLERVSGTMVDFMETENLMPMRPLFESVFSLLGYGRLDNTPAIDFMMFNTPEALLHALGNGYLLSMNGAFENVRQAMIDNQNLDIVYGKEVLRIKYTNQGGKPMKVVFGDNDVVEADFIVWTGLLPDLVKKASKVYRAKEKAILKTSTTFTASTCLLDVDNAVEIAPLQIFRDESGIFNYDNRVIISFNSHAIYENISRADYAAGNYLLLDGEAPTRRTHTILFYTDVEPTSADKLRQAGTEHFMTGFGASRVDIPVTDAFKYFPHFPKDKPQYNWKLYEMQGQHNIWITGSVASSEWTSGVLRHNELLLKKSGLLPEMRSGETNANNIPKFDPNRAIF